MTTPLRVVQEFYETREPDPAWEQALAAFTPPNAVVPYLVLHWKAGSREQPCQRWVLYEMVPLRLVDPVLVDELEGPDPSSVGQWSQHGPRRWMSSSMVSHDQWVLYRKHTAFKAYPLLLWVIQGTQGGHRWILSPQESKILRMRHLPDDVPAPGDLPYAEFDNRVIAMLAVRDRLKQVDIAKRTATRSRAILSANEDQRIREIEGQAELLKWLTLQVRQSIDSLSSQNLRDIVADLPRGHERYDADEDEVDRRFVEGQSAVDF